MHKQLHLFDSDAEPNYVLVVNVCHTVNQRTIGTVNAHLTPGASCSKLTTSLVNVSLQI